MKVVVTGARGFVGRNLSVRLGELGHEVLAIGREDDEGAWAHAVCKAAAVVHLAGENRPADPSGFETGNVETTRRLVALLKQAGNAAPVLYASSTQASLPNPYGRSKAEAESLLLEHANDVGARVAIFRLPNVFGKWARPNYNSAVATFCHRVARRQEIDVHDPLAALRLVYIDDVVDAFLRLLGGDFETGLHELSPVYDTTVGDLADTIRGFQRSRETLTTPRVGSGFLRALYSTYLSNLPTDEFHYDVPIHADPRGRFVEMLKTLDSGQFSYFTAGPGITRGGHYHHTKVEKFLVISGHAHFGFRNIATGERHEILVAGDEGRI